MSRDRMHYRCPSLSLVLVLSCATEAVEHPTPPRPLPAEVAAATGEAAPVRASGPAQCEVEADCVPVTCFTASACVPYAQKPECSGKLRNDIGCLAGADDVYCNGRCTCIEGQCGVHFTPNPKVRLPPLRSE